MPDSCCVYGCSLRRGQRTKYLGIGFLIFQKRWDQGNSGLWRYVGPTGTLVRQPRFVAVISFLVGLLEKQKTLILSPPYICGGVQTHHIRLEREEKGHLGGKILCVLLLT